MRLDLLYAHAADLGLAVEWADLGPQRRVDYSDHLRRIRLNHRLTRAQATEALCHELGHAAFGDRCTSRKIERRADEYGASLIIGVREYRRAERLVGEHTGALAEELGVTPHVIEAWRRWYRRRGAAS